MEENKIAKESGATAQSDMDILSPELLVAVADVILALEQGKVDALFADKTVYAGMRWDNPAIDAIDEPIETISNALIMAKEGYDENLLDQINEFVAKSKENGTLDALEEKWFGNSEPKEHPDYTKLTGETAPLKLPSVIP